MVVEVVHLFWTHRDEVIVGVVIGPSFEGILQAVAAFVDQLRVLTQL